MYHGPGGSKLFGVILARPPFRVHGNAPFRVRVLQLASECEDIDAEWHSHSRALVLRRTTVELQEQQMQQTQQVVLAPAHALFAFRLEKANVYGLTHAEEGNGEIVCVSEPITRRMALLSVL